MQLSETNEDPQVRKEVSDEDDFDDEPKSTLQFLKLLIVEKVLGQLHYHRLEQSYVASVSTTSSSSTSSMNNTPHATLGYNNQTILPQSLNIS